LIDDDNKKDIRNVWIPLTKSVKKSEIRETVEKVPPEELWIAYQNTREALMWIDFINKGRKIVRLPYGAGGEIAQKAWF
jgi:hypothetical protein